jgi:hypothetical protein
MRFHLRVLHTACCLLIILCVICHLLVLNENVGNGYLFATKTIQCDTVYAIHGTGRTVSSMVPFYHNVGTQTVNCSPDVKNPKEIQETSTHNYYIQTKHKKTFYISLGWGLVQQILSKQSPIQVLTRYNVASSSMLWVEWHGEWSGHHGSKMGFDGHRKKDTWRRV